MLSSFKLQISLIFILGFVTYVSSMGFYFAQDDFIHLYHSQVNSISDVLNFFNPGSKYEDIFFYRPLTTQFYFYINSKLFGLNPWPFHFEGLILHLVNSILFYLIILKLWKDQKIAFIASLFYTVSAIHFLSLFYISAFQQIGRTFFIFLGILFFINYYQTKKVKYYIGVLISFILSLLSKETSLIFPLLLFPILLIIENKSSIKLIFKNWVINIVPLVIICAVYLILRLSGFQSIFGEGSYQSSFSIFNIIQNLKWYLIWSFGLPEILSSYPSLKPNSLIQFGQELPHRNWVLILFFLTLILLGINLIKIKKLNIKLILSYGLLFLIPLIPVLFLSEHKYPQYLDLSFLGFAPIISWLLLNKNSKRWIGYLGVSIFIILQILSIQLSKDTHWTTHRSQVASFYNQEFEKNYQITEGSSIAFVGTENSAKELSYAMTGKYALMVWYPNKITEVIFTTTEKLPQKNFSIVYPIKVY